MSGGTPSILVHGGAGRIADDGGPEAREGCEAAVRAGLAVLAEGGTALDAAVAAVRVLEELPRFNAGVGAVLTRAGTVEVDAMVMDGRDLRVGAIAAVPNARRPIEYARLVLEDGEHVLLGGDAAWEFLRERGIEPCGPQEMVTERARRRLAEAVAKKEAREVDVIDPGTVGAVAIDAAGHVAAATSTGGINHKRRGRIGDTPLCGCGTYADDEAGAASATGHGEALIRATTALRCADGARSGLSAQAAADAAIDELGRRVGGEGGVIFIGRAGDLGAAHNSRDMSFAAGRLDGGNPGPIVSGLRVGDEPGLLDRLG